MVKKEDLSKVKEQKHVTMGLGLYESEKVEHKMKGEFFITLKHQDGSEEKHHLKNIIVDTASLLIARLLADGQTTIDPTGPAHGIWVLALGTGSPSWDKLNPPPATGLQELLESELTRKRFANVNFVRTDGSGLPSATITNILDFQTVFNESEAVGPLMEMGLFGGDANELIADSGTLINYRTFSVISKPNTSTLSITFRLTT